MQSSSPWPEHLPDFTELSEGSLEIRDHPTEWHRYQALHLMEGAFRSSRAVLKTLLSRGNVRMFAAVRPSVLEVHGDVHARPSDSTLGNLVEIRHIGLRIKDRLEGALIAQPCDAQPGVVNPPLKIHDYAVSATADRARVVRALLLHVKEQVVQQLWQFLCIEIAFSDRRMLMELFRNSFKFLGKEYETSQPDRRWMVWPDDWNTYRT